MKRFLLLILATLGIQHTAQAEYTAMQTAVAAIARPALQFIVPMYLGIFAREMRGSAHKRVKEDALDINRTLNTTRSPASNNPPAPAGQMASIINNNNMAPAQNAARPENKPLQTAETQEQLKYKRSWSGIYHNWVVPTGTLVSSAAAAVLMNYIIDASFKQFNIHSWRTESFETTLACAGFIAGITGHCDRAATWFFKQTSQQ